MKGKTYYGYTPARKGEGKITFEHDGETVTANAGPILLNKLPGVEVIGGYHSHTTTNDFSGDYSEGDIIRGDEGMVKRTGLSLYLGRESQVPWSSNIVVRVMELNDSNKITTRTVRTFKSK